MSLETVISGLTGTNQEILAQVKARTVSQPKTVWGADVQTILAGAGIVGFLKETAETTGTYSAFRDLCIQLMDRFGAGGEIDFRNPAVAAGIDMAFQHPTIVSLVEASAYGTVENMKTAIAAVGTEQVAEFPGVTLRDVIAITDPALAAQETSNAVGFSGISQVLTLTTATPAPESINGYAEISHDGVVWQRVATTGLTGISVAGQYKFRVNPGPLVSTGAQIRVILPYSIGAVIA